MPQLLTPESVLGQNEQILIYGRPKTGKTFLALTAPEPIYVLCVGPENELKTRWSKQFMQRYPEKKIYFDSVRETYGEKGEITDNPTGSDEVNNTLDVLTDSIERGEIPKPATLVVDNMTVLEDYQMNKSMIAGYELANAKEKTALKRYRDYGITKPGDSDYGAAQSIMNKFLNYTTKLKFHFIAIAHEYEQYANKKGESNSREKDLIGIYPLFVGKQRTEMARYFDNVWYTEKSGTGRNQQYTVRTIGTDIIVAGTRVGGVLDEIETDLDLTNAIEKFKEYPKTFTREDKQSVRDSNRKVRFGAN